MTQDQEVD